MTSCSPVRTWLAEQPADAARDEGIISICRAETKDVETDVIWSTQISDDKKRRIALDNYLGDWALNYRDAARAWIQAQPYFSPEEVTHYLEQIEISAKHE